MKKPELYTTIGLFLGLAGSILLAFSLNIQDAFPVNESMVQFNVTTQNGEIIKRTEASFVTIKQWIFYSGILSLIASFTLQIVGIFSKK